MFVFLCCLVGLSIGAVFFLVYFRSCHRFQVSGLQNVISALQQDISDYKIQMGMLHAERVQMSKELASALTDRAHLEKQLEGQGRYFHDLEEKMVHQFKSLANDLLEEKTEKFSLQSTAQVQQLLTPLHDKIQDFQKQVVAYNVDHLARNVALRTEIKQLCELNHKITHQADNLTKALRGNMKLQGSWGEFVLENILEQSGLVKNREYKVQPLLQAEGGRSLQPDIIVYLPSKQHIIIDAKVSLVDYEQFFNTACQADRKLYLKQHIQSIKRHIKILSEKNYQLAYNVEGIDFVLMFIPIEPAFALVVQEETKLFNEAYASNIVLVSPTNLIATLRMIANLWRQSYQNQYAVEIATQGGALYDKFVAFVTDLKQVGRQLDLTQKHYTEASKKLYQGKGNLIARAEKMKKLGARTSKNFQPDLFNKLLNEGDFDDEEEDCLS